MAGPRGATRTADAAPMRWRPTWLGWLLMAEGLALLATMAWDAQQRPLGSVIGIGLLAVLGVNAWFARRWVQAVAGEHVPPQRIVAGEDTMLVARISADGAAPPVEIGAIAPDGEARTIGTLAGLDSDGARLAWSVRFPRRGWHSLAPLTAANEQPFGVGIAHRAIGPACDVLVLPARGLIRRELRTRLDTWLEQIATGNDPGEDELARLRPYHRGDPPRSVHWRASARARELLVSERHTPAARHLALVIDTDASVVTPRRLDRLASVAATIVEHLLRRGWEVSLHGRFAPAGVTGDRDHLIATLAVLEPQGADHDLGELLPRNRACLVLASRAIELPPRHPRPLLLTLDESEQLVRLPRRLGF